MRSIVLMITGAGLVCLVGCGSDLGTQTSPTPPPVVVQAPPPPPPPPTSTVAARVEIRDLSVTVLEPPNAGGWFYYETRFRLSETGGTSGATIVRVVAATGDFSDETGQGCWRDVLRVPAGGALDAFDTGYENLVYCAPGTASHSRSSQVTVTITFTDDSGVMGSVSAVGRP